MNSQRPYFPFDTIEVPSVPYMSFIEAQACDWNVKMTREGCQDSEFPVDTLFAKVDWNPVRYDITKESSQNGFGDITTDSSRVDPVYSFVTWTDEYNLWYIYQFLFKTQEVKIEQSPANGYLTAINIDIQDEVIENGVHKLTLSFRAKREGSNYHGAFGLNGCCLPLFSEAPYEDCDTNDGDIDNNVPPCDTVSFSVSESGGNLTANVSGTPGSYSVNWYYQLNNSDPWQLIISGASSISLGAYGKYRAILTAQGCGQYIDQYLYSNPCYGFDVRIRRGNVNGLIAEVPGTFAGTTYAWQFNDGTGWVSLPDTTAAIVALETGDYRVTATNGDCGDQDTYYIAVTSECDFDASIDVDGDTATAVTDADSPTLTWTLENENGSIVIGSGNSVNMTETGIYWLNVVSGSCTKRVYVFFKSPDNCQKIEICNWEDMPASQTTVINNLCCDDTNGCPSLTLTITCVNRTLTIAGYPAGATITWSGPGGFTGTGNPVTFPASTPSGLFTATIVDGSCTYQATYNYTKPNAGTPVNNPIPV